MKSATEVEFAVGGTEAISSRALRYGADAGMVLAQFAEATQNRSLWTEAQEGLSHCLTNTAKLDPRNGAPSLTRQVRLFHNGKLASDGSETPVPPAVPSDPVRIDNFGNIRITTGVEAGEYVLQIVVRDKISNKVSTQWIDFEVVE